MDLLKNKKIKNSVIICTILISLIELFFVYKLFKEYKRIYQFSFPVTIIIIQPYWYILLFKHEKSNLKIRAVLIGVITISVPVIVYFTLPSYTYNEGKHIVQNYFEPNKELKFVRYSIGHDTIPVINNDEQLFINDRIYYYGVKLPKGNKYFVVDPLTGKLALLSKGYWPEDLKIR